MPQKDMTREELIKDAEFLKKRLAELEKLYNELGQQQQHMKRLEAVVRDSNDAIIMQDMNGQIFAWNKGAEKIYGYEEKEALGMNIERLVPENKIAEFKDFARRMRAGEDVVSFETQRITKNGGILDVWLTMTRIEEHHGNSVISTGRDITEINQVKEQLKNIQGQLIQSEKMKDVGVMAAGIAHEVKNPLGIILQGINYFEEGFPADKKDDLEILQMMKNNLKRADKIVRALLEFSRDQELAIKPLNINSIIETSLDLTTPTVGAGGIEIVKELSEGLPEINVDENKIEQLFVILFNNAKEAMPEGGKIYVRSYSPITGKTAGGVVVEVEDTGKGIEKDVMENIFDPFFTTKNKAKGTGLGLSVAKKILEMHGGLIRAESEKGKGAKFTIIFKLAQGG